MLYTVVYIFGALFFLSSFVVHFIQSKCHILFFCRLEQKTFPTSQQKNSFCCSKTEENILEAHFSFVSCARPKMEVCTQAFASRNAFRWQNGWKTDEKYAQKYQAINWAIHQIEWTTPPGKSSAVKDVTFKPMGMTKEHLCKVFRPENELFRNWNSHEPFSLSLSQDIFARFFNKWFFLSLPQRKKRGSLKSFVPFRLSLLCRWINVDSFLLRKGFLFRCRRKKMQRRDGSGC